ncbi:MAG: NAD(P)H-dependent oxidoreductase [Methanomicrobiales archaeon]|nr:NAD(P)H-dependent oxidoreductase [Methanomicrobiales archaeon]MDI6875970.1 NAD(P)H-dependent oxidoreductase [Methanomicrobiales archaeon]
MPICYIYHSRDGHTRGVAERCASELGGERIEVRDKSGYNAVTVYLIGAFRARLGRRDPIEPKAIDVSACDTLVVGSPVWAGKPTPAMNSALDALTGARGKKGIVYVTCGGSPGVSMELLKRGLAARGVQVKKGEIFTHRDLPEGEKIQRFVETVRRVSSA